MNFRNGRLSGEPIIITTFTESYQAGREAPVWAKELTELLDSSPEPVYVLVDTRMSRVPVSDAVAGLDLVKPAHQNKAPHPKALQYVVVAGAASISSPYGGENVQIVRNMDEGLSYIRRQTGAS